MILKKCFLLPFSWGGIRTIFIKAPYKITLPVYLRSPTPPHTYSRCDFITYIITMMHEMVLYYIHFWQLCSFLYFFLESLSPTIAYLYSNPNLIL